MWVSRSDVRSRVKAGHDASTALIGLVAVQSTAYEAYCRPCRAYVETAEPGGRAVSVWRSDAALAASAAAVAAAALAEEGRAECGWYAALKMRLRGWRIEGEECVWTCLRT
eukprot:5472700-Pleurochrysis_carterae.AAC.1